MAGRKARNKRQTDWYSRFDAIRRLAIHGEMLFISGMRKLIASIIVFVSMFSYAMGQIEAGQSVIVKIMGVPAEEKAKIDEVYPISKAGFINLPFVNELPAAGLEAGQLAKSIQKAYKDGGYYNNAVIQVIANKIDIEPQEQQVHIAGHVRAPGPRPFKKGLTIFQAIQAGGGPDEFGAMNRVKLLREGKMQIIDLEKSAGKMVVSEVHDTIEVPEKNWRGR